MLHHRYLHPFMAVCGLFGTLACGSAGDGDNLVPGEDGVAAAEVTQDTVGSGSLAAAAASSSCLDGITNYGSAGPFRFTTRAVGRIWYWVPAVPSGCRVPVVHLANGTGALCGMYGPVLERLASHGFLGACYEDTNTGAGTQGLEAIDTAYRTFPTLLDTKIGSTGHSQGGQASFTVLARAEQKYGSEYTYAGLAIEPASGFGAQPFGTTWQAMYGSIKSPTFMFSGLITDGLVAQTWVQSAYNATARTQESYFWTATGATHIPVPNDLTNQVAVSWFRWKLLGDKKACTAFKALPGGFGSVWAQVAAKNQQSCN